MIRVVLDTNILVSGLLSTFGNSAAIINAITDRVIACFYSDAIIREYTDVLSRPKFGFPQEKADALIRDISRVGHQIVPTQSTHFLPDESDRIFYDVAKASKAYLITGNNKHYPNESFILSPAEFVDKFHKRAIK